MHTRRAAQWNRLPVGSRGTKDCSNHCASVRAKMLFTHFYIHKYPWRPNTLLFTMEPLVLIAEKENRNILQRYACRTRRVCVCRETWLSLEQCMIDHVHKTFRTKDVLYQIIAMQFPSVVPIEKK